MVQILPTMRVRVTRRYRTRGFFLPFCSTLRKIYDTACDLTCFTYQNSNEYKRIVSSGRKSAKKGMSTRQKSRVNSKTRHTLVHLGSAHNQHMGTLGKTRQPSYRLISATQRWKRLIRSSRPSHLPVRDCSLKDFLYCFVQPNFK